MKLKALSSYDIRVLTAMADVVIPQGGDSFTLGAADLEEQWLPRADYFLWRTPFLFRTGLRYFLRAMNFLCPLLYLKKFKPVSKMNSLERVELFNKLEKYGITGFITILLVKFLICPAFYGLPEAKAAIDYQEKFPSRDNFEGIKE